MNEMMAGIGSEAEARAAFYRTLAGLYFKELDQEGIERLAQADLANVGIDDDLMREGYADIAVYLRRRDGGTRQELACDFAGAILGAGSYEERRATPFESVFTSENGLLMQEARDGVYRAFCEAHVAVNEELRMPEDHLSFEFEFMALRADELARSCAAGDEAAARVSLEEQRSFHESHLLNWIDAYCDCLDACARTRFYRGVSKVTRGFVHVDAELMADAAMLLHSDSACVRGGEAAAMC